ncbi:unnamed protein product [Chondrus crispus]|uniref:Uncharacterized protein n=1 Tax=Chondrus crispus TaxID=2769 RepID=R7QLQ6_CHOCR|nr:unnamed protein product [Chondrus crispus]CDF38330.1 unnamed protein product [Chondrus crispus]|eukprot:XP_005718215.1 unnamed protein product [Chondrus crispus]
MRNKPSKVRQNGNSWPLCDSKSPLNVRVAVFYACALPVCLKWLLAENCGMASLLKAIALLILRGSLRLCCPCYCGSEGYAQGYGKNG